MNQILSTKQTPKRESMSLGTSMLIFGICMIVFGVCLISTSSYAVYKSISENRQLEAQSEPVINVSENGDNTVTISATHATGIKEISYSWSNEEENRVIEGNNQQKIEETIELPEGINTLKAVATATNGQSLAYEREYTSTEGIQIVLTSEDSNVLVKVDSKTKISFVTYKWDDKEEKTKKIDDMSGEFSIKTPTGEHVLTITAVDENNNTQVKTQEVSGVTKPELEVTQDGSDFNVKVSDEIGLEKVDVVLNGNGYRVRLEGVKEKNFSYPLEDGENTLKVTVYNTNGKSNSDNKTYTK